MPASAEMAAHLALAPGAPVFSIKQTVYLSDGTPVEYSDVWLRGDKFSLSAVVHRTAPRRQPPASGAPDQKLSFQGRHPDCRTLPGRIAHAGSRLGEHTVEVLKAAGYSDEQIAVLRSREII